MDREARAATILLTNSTEPSLSTKAPAEKPGPLSGGFSFFCPLVSPNGGGNPIRFRLGLVFAPWLRSLGGSRQLGAGGSQFPGCVIGTEP